LRIGPTVEEDELGVELVAEEEDELGVGVGVEVGVSEGVGVGVGVEVGVSEGVGVGVGEAQTTGLTVLVSSVTAPSADTPRAKTLPFTIAPVVSVMSWAAITVPTNEEYVPRVVELPTFQNTLQPGPEPPLLKTTDEADAVVRVLPILKTQTELGSPWALRVSTPVNPADELKQ
jgi:hypothetical protein